MKLAPFLVEHWSEQHRDSVRYNLAASTGAQWTLPDLRALLTDAEREAFDRAALTYCPGRGRDSLREALASMYDAEPDEVLTFTGAAEALLALFFLAAEPGANVVIPNPVFPPITNLPEALGLETRRYALRFESGFATDLDEIERLVDARTKLILVNTPHNPSGAGAYDDQVIRANAEWKLSRREAPVEISRPRRAVEQERRQRSQQVSAPQSPFLSGSSSLPSPQTRSSR